MAELPGTSSGQHQSAVYIPVPAAEAVVGPWRAKYDPVAASGVPAHITLVVPWLAPEKISDAAVLELADELSGTKAFDFNLDGVGWFGRHVLWLAPQPAEPFRALTAVLAERFSTPPYRDAFDEVVPHLTVGHASGEPEVEELEEVADLLTPRLPVICRAEQVCVMVGDGQHWSLRARLALG
ncbi:MAG: 2'-5' RNA ligase family protein [Acidimicrobiales bacterium]